VHGGASLASFKFALLGMVLFFALASDTFLTVRNMTNVLGQASLALTAGIGLLPLVVGGKKPGLQGRRALDALGGRSRSEIRGDVPGLHGARSQHPSEGLPSPPRLSRQPGGGLERTSGN